MILQLTIYAALCAILLVIMFSPPNDPHGYA